MFLILGICITLASLFILNALASLVTALFWQVIKRPARYCTAATRAATLFVLRMSPPAISLVCVTTLLLPAYIKHEPRVSEEVVGFKLDVGWSSSVVTHTSEIAGGDMRSTKVLPRAWRQCNIVRDV